MDEKLLIIIPAYNEEKNIGILLRKMQAAAIDQVGDILVINDGSTDNTEKIVRELGIEILNKAVNMGYGTSLQLGYKYASRYDYKYVIQLDADGQHDISNIALIYQALLKRGSNFMPGPNIVIGSRFLSEDNEMKVRGLKKLVIKFFRKVIKVFTKEKITDPTSGLQGLNREAFSFYAGFGNFDCRYPDINMLIQMLLMGYRITEVPAKMYPRLEGKSMHAGIIQPLKYMTLMSLSTISIVIRQRKDYYNLLKEKTYHHEI